MPSGAKLAATRATKTRLISRLFKPRQNPVADPGRHAAIALGNLPTIRTGPAEKFLQLRRADI